MKIQSIQKDRPYVYHHLIGDKVFYVGCGKNERYATTKGRNPLWHKIVDEAGGFQTEITRLFDSTKEALAFEKQEIKRIKPEANGGAPRPEKPKGDYKPKTTNIRITIDAHKKLQELAKKKRQNIIVVIDELVARA